MAPTRLDLNPDWSHDLHVLVEKINEREQQGLKRWLSTNLFAIVMFIIWVLTFAANSGGWIRGQDISTASLEVKLSAHEKMDEQTYARKDVISEQLKRLEEKVDNVVEMVKRK